MNGHELEELRDRLQDVNVEVFRALRSQQEEIAELEQVEQERDDWRAVGERAAFGKLAVEGERDEAQQGVEYALACIGEWQERAVQAEARLARVPALVETLKVIAADGDDWAGTVAEKAIDAWEKP